MSLLERIQSPADVKALTRPEIDMLAAEMRHVIIQTVARNAGHLAPNLGVVELLSSPRMSILWQQEFGAGPNDSQLLPIILSAADLVRGTYQSFATANESRDASDTLVTKVLLGTLGCIPACDRYFIDGFKAAGFSYSYLNAKFVTRLSQIAARNLLGLRTAQSGIASATGVRYPLMKLLDMYFWQLGYERGNSEPHA